MAEDKPRGILRNKSVNESSESNAERLDRQEVIRNTRLNAQLAAESSKGDKIRAKIAEIKAHQHSSDGEEENNGEKRSDHLQWDEINLYKTELEKCATMKIDEPKTPYEGGFNPEGEYYKEDEEEIPEFELGSGAYDNASEKASESLNGGEVVKDLQQEEQEQEEEPNPTETAEDRHKRFEEMRRQHYHLKGNALKQKIEISDDEDE